MDQRELAVALLGPLEVRRGGAPVRLTAGRLRTLLATLALSAGGAVSVERLARALWGEELPAHPRRSLQTQVSRLRRALGPAAIRTTPDGYRLDADPDRIDVLRFRRLLAEAGRAPDTGTELSALEEALALWRGPPFDGVDSDWLRASESAFLHELHLSATERRVDLYLDEGRHGEVAPELMDLAGRHPLRESLWERLLVVLGRCGRRAEALAGYERLRRHLIDELGTEPSAGLRRIHARLLRADPSTPVGSGSGRQRMAVFAGRVTDREQIDDLFRDGDGGRFSGVCVISDAVSGRRLVLTLVWAGE